MTRSGLAALATTLLATVAVAVVVAGCGAEADGATSDEAHALLKRAFGQSAKSGDLELRLNADLKGIRSLDDPLELTLAGPFKPSATGKLPQLDWKVRFDGGGLKLSGGLVATDENAYLTLQGRGYELGAALYAKLARNLSQKQPNQSLALRSLGVDPLSWLKDTQVEEGDPVGGDATRKVTGSVDVRAAVKDLVGVIGSPAVRKELDSRGNGDVVPKPTDKDIDQIEDAIKGIDVELNVDRKGNLRRFVAEVDLDAKSDGKDLQGKLSVSYVLRKVGGDPVIRPPADPRPLSELFGGLGGLGALGGGFGGTLR